MAYAVSLATELTIRRATVDDAASVGAIYNDTLPFLNPLLPVRFSGASDSDLSSFASYQGAPMPIAERHWMEWLRQHMIQRRPMWLACQDGMVVGWLSTIGFSERPHPGRTSEISIYVHPSHWRQGVGASLLSHALHQAPRHGLDRLLAFVWEGNQPSLNLFRQFEFQDWGRVPKFVSAFHERRDLHVLGIELGASAAFSTRAAAVTPLRGTEAAHV